MAQSLPRVSASFGAPVGPSTRDPHTAAVNAYATYVFPAREQYFCVRPC